MNELRIKALEFALSVAAANPDLADNVVKNAQIFLDFLEAKKEGESDGSALLTRGTD